MSGSGTAVVVLLLLFLHLSLHVIAMSDVRISAPNASAAALLSPVRHSQHFIRLPSFDRTLSPRQIRTKYGLLRGLLISHPAASSPILVSSTSSSGINNSSNASSQHRPPLIPTSDSGLHPVEGFLGVPYASPPIGSLRFMPPVTPAHWRGVRMANSLAPSCPQKLPKAGTSAPPSAGRSDYMKRMKAFVENHSEDCLYLNVYAPFDRGQSFAMMDAGLDPETLLDASAE